MFRRIVLLAPLLTLCLLCQCQKPSVADVPTPGSTDRSPIDVALLEDGRRAVVVHHTADSVALVDLQTGKVLDEARTGRKPAAVAVHPDGKRLAVSNHWSHDVHFFAVEGNKLVRQAVAPVGPLPRGLLYSNTGDRLFVAVAGADEVVAIDPATHKVTRRWPAPREPRELALSADGRWLAAASSRSGHVRVWNTATGELHWERQIVDAFNLRGLAFTADGDHVICAHVVRRDLPVTKGHIEEGWIIDSRLTRLPLKANVTPPYLQIALDVRGEAMGDPHGLALSPDGKLLAVTGSGSHELILMHTENLPWNTDPGDFIDGRLLDGKQHRRVALGGRPLAAKFAKDRIVIANYLSDALQIVDPGAGKLERTVALSEVRKPTLARHGEAIFYDAKRSHNQWFSCHTCHTDGHTSGQNFDTLNDDSFGTTKLTPTLRNVARTGPWTWHGWQKDLGASVAKSFTDTMYGPPGAKEDVRAVVAFLETLEHPPLPTRDVPKRDVPKRADRAIARGAALFSEKARCARCHRPPFYTVPGAYDVKLDSGGSPHDGFNPPSLNGLSDRGPYLHDGRAKTLEEVLRTWHTPRHVGGAALTEDEERDLLAFLRSL